MITGSDLSWAYGGQRVLDAVSLAAPHGRVLGLIGPNGSGKTTLLRLLHGALASPTGEVTVDGDRLVDLAPRDAARRVAVVVQEAGGENAMSVAEMVLLGRGPHLATFQRTGRADHEVAADALSRVGAQHLAHRSYAGLSGGERQRVLIARALAQQATHLLLDEPTNHLDIRFQHEVLNLAARYCDDLVLLGGGGIVATGTVDDVLRPAVLEPVYGIGVERVEARGELHLLFRPHPTTPTREDLTA